MAVLLSRVCRTREQEACPLGTRPHAGSGRDDALIHALVPLRHHGTGESSLEARSTRPAIKVLKIPDRAHELLGRVTDVPGDAVFDDLADRSKAASHDRCAARERLDLYQTERLRPGDRKEERESVLQEDLLLAVFELSD